MPAPQAGLLNQLTKTNFIAQGIVLPINWQDQGPQYSDAFAVSERSVAPNSPMTLFQSATLNKYHVNTAKKTSDNYASFIQCMSGAICDAIGNWLSLASIAGVMIFGPTGTLLPGCVIGPPLAPLILAGAPMDTPEHIRYSTAIANALGTAWQAWHMGLMGTLMYPMFAAVPAPVGPPSPNVPIPLVALTSPGEMALSAAALKGAMIANLGTPMALHHVELFDSIAQAFNTVFQMFKATTMVLNVIGTGPVPIFAPPWVPVGPVLGGTGNGAPGCLK